jgi:hypothetical protein
LPLESLCLLQNITLGIIMDVNLLKKIFVRELRSTGRLRPDPLVRDSWDLGQWGLLG